MRNTHALFAALVAATLTLPVYAGDDVMEERYETAKQRCEVLDGDEKDACMEEAKANKKAAKAQYKSDKEKCDALEGDSKDACLDRVKSSYNR